MTETGSWFAKTENEFEPGSFEGKTAVSFAIPLEEKPGAVIVEKEETPPGECDDGEGTPAGPENPEADSGFFCIFVAKMGSSPPEFFPAVVPLFSGASVGLGASTTGSILTVFSTANEEVWGTFAVTG